MVFPAALLLAAAVPLTSPAAKDSVPTGPNAPRAAATSASCRSPMLDYTSSTQGGNWTTSLTYVDIPEASVTFEQKKAGCIIVKFDGPAYVFGTAVEDVAAFLDGNEMFPGEIVFGSGDYAYWNSRAASWVATNVTAGAHTVQMKFESTNGQNVNIDVHTTAVWHN